ncbi:CCAAT/enhancer-binding protein zeta-like [Nannospalax galili]|uniref:CCAAT/enhancer-binding protein zeta-like n=1 Tax=Nannospalax galili TaxID=1026970 RepID=UPI0004ED5166|nr:CCAAT/enhancer-binding protein zeta-like [Nannospalax galili]
MFMRHTSSSHVSFCCLSNNRIKIVVTVGSGIMLVAILGLGSLSQFLYCSLADTFEDDNCFTPKKDDLDFASNVKKKTKGAKDDLGDSESSDDELGNLDDDEVSLGSMNDEEFEIDEDGGTFMDVLDDESEGIPEFDEVSPKANTKKSKRKSEDDFDFVGSFEGKNMLLISVNLSSFLNKSITHYIIGNTLLQIV